MSSTSPAVTSPLAAIIEGVAGGAGSLEEVAARTGLPRSVVDAGADHLVRLGYLNAESIEAGCPTGGCRACPSGLGDAPGCGPDPRGVPRPAGSRLVAVTIARRR